MKALGLSKKVVSMLVLLVISSAAYAQNKVVAYVPNWIDLNSFSNTIAYSKITHINIAFENLYNDNGDLSFNTADNILITRAHANGLKVLVSIGGGSASGDQQLTNRYFTQISSSKRAAFVSKISAYLTAHNFDGIDVDLEGPSINGDYGAFIAALSGTLKPQGKLLTAALSQGYGGSNVPNSVFQYMDFINIMAYDGAGYWDPNSPGQHSSLDFAKSNTTYWLNRGLPKSKAVLGVPFYGYGFGAAFINRDYPYSTIVATYPGAENKDQVGSTIWYNGIPTIKAKTNYAFDQGIGGIMIWSLDNDGPGAKSLLTAIDQVFDERSLSVPQSPFAGAIPLPGKIEAENYDFGGQGVAYNDLSTGNDGSAYRTDAVDIEATTDAGTGYNLGWISDGEWVEYTVNVSFSGNYTIAFRTAALTAGAVRMEVDGVDLTGTVVLPNTGGYQLWATTAKTNITLPAGQHIVRLFAVTGGFNLNYVTVSAPPQSPYNNTIVSLPGKIEAENYDNGGQTVAYNDLSISNEGGAYRTDAVDIEATTDAGAGYNVGWTSDGEWLEYTVNVTTSANYTLAFRTAALTAGAIRLEVDGADLTGTVALPNTGGYQLWATTNKNIALSAGQHIVRLFVVTGGFNLNYVTATISNQPPIVSLTTNGTSFTAPASIVLSATATDADGSISKVEFYNGASLIGTSTIAPYTLTWNNVAAGVYSLTAKATDNSNATATSGASNVTVTQPVETPYGGTPWSIPGTVQAEHFNNGGEGIAYHDVETTNQGGAFRLSEGVDLEATTDIGGGYNAGYTADGEWLDYTVNVTAAGTYNVSFRTASTSASGVIRMEIDGAAATGVVPIPNTGGWQLWSTTTVTGIAFSAGVHEIRVYTVTGGFNLNSFSVALPTNALSYLRASGKNIVNDKGNFIIKAANLGNFMVQEGYMNNLGGAYQHVIRQKIADVVGIAARDQFYTDYYKNFITKADIDSLAKWGFNTVRLPMHYSLFTPLGQPDTYFESGFVMVDNIVNWCKANNMYVILDLHAAPGGQSSGDISDYVAGQPSLWESEANRAQTVKLWRKFAERYANEPVVGGYDLINETNWTLANNNALLMQIMKDITATIRQVDNNHIVFIEGNSYANDYNGLTPKWDNNMVYSFHKYWNDNVQGSLNFIFAIRDGQNVPIWLGEFGENSNSWIADAVTLMSANNIGWAIWPYKKMSSVSSMGSYKEPANWSALASYIGGGAKPSASVGQAILNEWLQNIKVQNGTTNKGYLYALFGQTGTNATIPFVTVSLPSKVLAAHYDEGRNGYAYNDANFQNTQFGSTVGSSSSWNNGWYYRNDGVDLQYSTAENGPTIGWTANNDWMQYTVNVATAGTYTVKVRVAGNGGTMSLSYDGVTVINTAGIPATGGWDQWQTVTLGTVSLSAGKHTFRATINTAGYNVSYFDFSTAALAVNQTSNTCSGLSVYQENGGYVPGSIVQNGGNRYQCKPYPSSGWCNGAAWAYGAGIGEYWSDAWTLLGSCSQARVGETDAVSSSSVADISNAPNPFSGSTEIKINVTEAGAVSVKLYDMKGLEMATVVEQYLDAGTYSYVFDASVLNATLYLMKYTSANGTVVKKIIKSE